MEDQLRLYIRSTVNEAFDERLNELITQLDQVGLIMAKVSNSDPLLTYSEISEEFHISKRTLGKLRNSGILVPEVKGGKELLFKRSSVIKALQERPRIKPRFLC